MKSLYARLVLWLIRPALDRVESERQQPRAIDVTTLSSADREWFFANAIEDSGSWFPYSECEGRTLK